PFPAVRQDRHSTPRAAAPLPSAWYACAVGASPHRSRHGRLIPLRKQMPGRSAQADVPFSIWPFSIWPFSIRPFSIRPFSIGDREDGVKRRLRALRKSLLAECGDPDFRFAIAVLAVLAVPIVAALAY